MELVNVDTHAWNFAISACAAVNEVLMKDKNIKKIILLSVWRVHVAWRGISHRCLLRGHNLNIFYCANFIISVSMMVHKLKTNLLLAVLLVLLGLWNSRLFLEVDYLGGKEQITGLSGAVYQVLARSIFVMLLNFLLKASLRHKNIQVIMRELALNLIVTLENFWAYLSVVETLFFTHVFNRALLGVTFSFIEHRLDVLGFELNHDELVVVC